MCRRAKVVKLNLSSGPAASCQPGNRDSTSVSISLPYLIILNFDLLMHVIHLLLLLPQCSEMTLSSQTSNPLLPLCPYGHEHPLNGSLNRTQTRHLTLEVIHLLTPVGSVRQITKETQHAYPSTAESSHSCQSSTKGGPSDVIGGEFPILSMTRTERRPAPVLSSTSLPSKVYLAKSA